MTDTKPSWLFSILFNFLGDEAESLRGDECCRGGDIFPLWQWIRVRAFAVLHGGLLRPPGGVWQRSVGECVVKWAFLCLQGQQAF